MRFQRRVLPWAVAAGLLLCGCHPGVLAAQQPPRDVPAPVLRVTTRLVLVDAVVTDKQGRHVEELTPADLTLLEDGKPQRIASFDLAQPGLAATRPRPAVPPLPPDIYTNRAEYRAAREPLTVILLDALNTPVQDQAYARTQMLRYLDTQLQPSQQVAVYTLGQSLRLLQDFTDNPQLLKAAVQSFTPEKSFQQFIEDVDRRLPAGPRGNVTREGDPRPESRQLFDRLRDFYSEQARVALKARVGITLSAFQIIARSLAGYPGRKDLIWVSASFPLSTTKQIIKYGDTPSDPNYRSVEDSFEGDLQKTSSLLTDAQVAVYPVDARGLVGSVLTDASSPGTDELGLGKLGADYGAAVTDSNSKLLASQASMEQLASDTGGRVFMNRNDVDNAVALSIADSASYYVLSYYPEDKGWDGKFRKIQLKVNRPGLVVRHRQGYFAANPSQWDKQGKDIKNAELMSAMQSESPSATLVIFDVRVVPPAIAGRMQVPVDLLVDPRTLAPEDTGGGSRRYRVEFHVVAYTSEGKVATSKDAAIEAPLTPEKFTAVQQQGFPLRTQIELPPGRYRIRVGVRDLRTGFIGTVDVPLALEKK
ncbi:MAG: VWA domain-containing protein [Acidobacteria bacterium]|nr:VWA domain-containing protein [Acidobacteriota bacterium]